MAPHAWHFGGPGDRSEHPATSRLCNTRAMPASARPRVRRSALALAAALFGGGATLFACAAPGLPPSAPGPTLGRPLPDFTRRTVEGTPFASEGLRGKVVVVEFFAQYCEPCWRALPAVQKLAAGDPDLLVLGIGEDEYASETQSMARQLGLSFPVLHDAGNEFAARLRVGKIPATLVLDRNGLVRWQARPGDGLTELKRAVAALRREPPG